MQVHLNIYARTLLIAGPLRPRPLHAQVISETGPHFRAQSARLVKHQAQIKPLESMGYIK